LVHPSIMPDAMPTVLKEALAVGTPVIASDLAGIPEILDHGRCGVLVPAGDVGALADAIAALLRDEARRREYATVGRQHAERLFDLRRTGQRLAEQLRSTPRRNGMATSGSVAR
jgi:glycosyltransferase involved in cell wall biosynthesis